MGRKVPLHGRLALQRVAKALGLGDVLDVFTDPHAERLVRAKSVSAPPPQTIGPRETVRLRYELSFSPKLAATRDDGTRKRVRPYVDLYYVWEGRPYHTDAWLPRVAVTASGQ